MSVRIVRAVSADAARVSAVAALTFPLACPPDSPAADIAAHIASKLSVAAFEAYIAASDHVVLIASDDADAAAAPAASGEASAPAVPLLGYAMLVVGEPDDAVTAGQLTARPTGELSKIYVDPAHHGRGVAGALMSAAVAEASARGLAGLWLGTNEANARAQRFYEKSGFARIGTRTFQLATRTENDYIFERVL